MEHPDSGYEQPVGSIRASGALEDVSAGGTHSEPADTASASAGGDPPRLTVERFVRAHVSSNARALLIECLILSANDGRTQEHPSRATTSHFRAWQVNVLSTKRNFRRT